MASDGASRPRDGQLGLGPVLVPPQSLALRDVVWGVDPQTTRVGVGILAPGGDGAGPRVAWDVRSLPRNPGDLARWFSMGYQELVPFFGQLRVTYGQPLLVLVEEPFGGGGKAGDKRPRTVHPSSNRMLGVILAALGRACGGMGTMVELVQPNSWKRAAMGAGKGNASPDAYLEWAQEVAGYTGDLHDEAAGIGIATAAGVRLSASSGN